MCSPTCLAGISRRSHPECLGIAHVSALLLAQALLLPPCGCRVFREIPDCFEDQP